VIESSIPDAVIYIGLLWTQTIDLKTHEKKSQRFAYLSILKKHTDDQKEASEIF
jgi:hypothetical protein